MPGTRSAAYQTASANMIVVLRQLEPSIENKSCNNLKNQKRISNKELRKNDTKMGTVVFGFERA